MARVLVATQPWGVLWEKDPTSRILSIPLSGHAASISTTVYAASTGPSTVAFVTNANGELPGWVEEGTYTLTVNSVAKTVEAVSGAVPARVAAIEDGSAWSGATVGDVWTYGTPPVWAPPSGGANPDHLVSNALANSVTGNGTTDDAAAIQTWLDALPTGSVGYLPGRGRTYRADAGFTVPAGKGLISDGVSLGSPPTIIKLGTVGGKVTIADGWHPEIGGFEVHGGTTGARVANIGFHVGQVICWAFRPVTVRYTLQKAIRIERAQNCLFQHLTAYSNSGDGLCIEDGAGNNVIQKYDASSNLGYAVAFRQTVGTPTLHVQPSFNTIESGMIERAYEGATVAPALVYHGAGNLNRLLSGVTLASAVPSGPHSTIRMERVGTGVTASSLVIDGVPVFGAAAYTTAIEMLGGCAVHLGDRTSLNSHLLGLSMTDTDLVTVFGHFQHSCTTLASKSSGAVAVSTLILRREDYFTRRRFMAASTEIESEKWVLGESFPRRRTLASGAELWGTGAASPSVQTDMVTGFFRVAAGGIQILNGDHLISTAGKGIRVKEGSDAKQGVATLAAGTVAVSNTSVTASSRILLTAQDGSTTGALRVSARTAGTSFTITSSNNADTGVVAYQIFEPA